MLGSGGDPQRKEETPCLKLSEPLPDVTSPHLLWAPLLPLCLPTWEGRSGPLLLWLFFLVLEGLCPGLFEF
jgi:hypothetical protein